MTVYNDDEHAVELDSNVPGLTFQHDYNDADEGSDGASDLGIHFSSSDAEELQPEAIEEKPLLMEPLKYDEKSFNESIGEDPSHHSTDGGDVYQFKPLKSKPTNVKQNKDLREQSAAEKALRLVSSSHLKAECLKPLSFASLLHNDKKSSSSNGKSEKDHQMELIRRHLTPEQFAALPSKPCLSADTVVKDSWAEVLPTILVLPPNHASASQNTKRKVLLGRAASLKPLTPCKPCSLDKLNARLDVRMTANAVALKSHLTQRLAHHRLQQQKQQKHKQPESKPSLGKPAPAPFGYDRKQEEQAFLEKMRAGAQGESLNKAFLMSEPEINKDSQFTDSFVVFEPEQIHSKDSTEESEAQETEESEFDAVDDISDGKQPTLAVFFDDEAESGSERDDEDEEDLVDHAQKHRKSSQTKEDSYDVKQYKEDLRGFIAKPKALPQDSLDQRRALDAQRARDEDAAALQSLVRALNVPVGENASWMARLAHDYKQPQQGNFVQRSKGKQKPLKKRHCFMAEEEDRVALQQLRELGFERTRLIKLDSVHLFPEETKGERTIEAPSELGQYDEDYEDRNEDQENIIPETFNDSNGEEAGGEEEDTQLYENQGFDVSNLASEIEVRDLMREQTLTNKASLPETNSLIRNVRAVLENMRKAKQHETTE